MQRIEEGHLIVSCDFCRADWDGASPVIEGHRGSILCLDCLKLALVGLQLGPDPFSCPLCLRDNIPSDVERWSHPDYPATCACRNCVQQAADVFDRDGEVEWNWDARPDPRAAR